jgi:hypothetical protein
MNKNGFLKEKKDTRKTGSSSRWVKQSSKDSINTDIRVICFPTTCFLQKNTRFNLNFKRYK